MGLVGVAAGASTGPRDNDAPNAVGDEDPTVALPSLEIGRVERQWLEEAKSYPRRARS